MATKSASKTVTETKAAVTKAAEETKAAAKKAAEETKTAAKTVAKKAAEETKTAAKKAAEDTKTAAKKAAAETKAAAKKTAKTAKTTVRKAAKKDMKVNAFVEFYGKQVEEKEIIADVKKAWTKSGNKVGDIKTMDLYIKPEEDKVYYVINGTEGGSVAF